MKRICESLAFVTALAPKSVSASTDPTSGYVDASGADEVCFILSAGALGAGKSLTATLMAAGDAEGSGAAAVGEAVTFTDAVGTEPQTALISYKVDPQKGRYLAVKFQHDAADAVVCGVLAAAKQVYRPAPNAWTVLM